MSFPQRRRSLTVCPLQSDRCSAADHRAVPQVRSVRRWFPTADRYIGTGRVWSRASRCYGRVANGLFIAQPAAGVAITTRWRPPLGYYGGDAVGRGLHELSRSIRADSVRYVPRCACRQSSWTNDRRSTARDVSTLPTAHRAPVDVLADPLLTSSPDAGAVIIVAIL